MIPLLLCFATLCSDDVRGVLGNERLCWDPSVTATYYTVAVWDRPPAGVEPEFVPCASTNDVCKDLPGTACYGDRLVVEACKPDPEGGPDLCSGFNTLSPVEVLPFACVRGRVACTYSDDGDARNDRCEVCEYPCFDGAPLRLPNLQGCVL